MSRLEREQYNNQGENIGNMPSLLTPGVVEQLMSEGRTPMPIGSITIGNGEPQLQFQIPPQGFDPINTNYVYIAAGGVFTFVAKDGSQKMASTQTLTEDESQQVTARIQAEQNRLKGDD